MLDLDLDGVELISANDSNIFLDVNHDGWRERVGWAAPDDGVLTFDINSDGKVNLETEVSFVGYKPEAQTDLDGLAAFDTDGDGKLTAQDAAWLQFGVFRDANSNGKQEAGERLTLEEVGVTAIALQREGIAYLDHGNVVFGSASVQFSDGSTGRAADVMFAGQGVALPRSASDLLAGVPMAPGGLPQDGAVQVQPDPTSVQSLAQEARLTQMALVFNQHCTSASANAEALGFVNWAQAGADEGWTAAPLEAADQLSPLSFKDVQSVHSSALAA